jgi:hypothetical protein
MKALLNRLRCLFGAHDILLTEKSMEIFGPGQWSRHCQRCSKHFG